MGKSRNGGVVGSGKEPLQDRITCCSLVLGNQRKRVKRKTLRVLQEGEVNSEL